MALLKVFKRARLFNCSQSILWSLRNTDGQRTEQTASFISQYSRSVPERWIRAASTKDVVKSAADSSLTKTASAFSGNIRREWHLLGLLATWSRTERTDKKFKLIRRACYSCKARWRRNSTHDAASASYYEIKDIRNKQYLRRDPPGLRVLHGQNYVPKLFTFYCKLLCYCFKLILSKEIISNNTKHRKQMSQFHWIPVNRLKDSILQISYTWDFTSVQFTWFSRLWALKFIFSGSDKKLLLVLSRIITYIFSF